MKIIGKSEMLDAIHTVVRRAGEGYVYNDHFSECVYVIKTPEGDPDQPEPDYYYECACIAGQVLELLGGNVVELSRNEGDIVLAVLGYGDGGGWSGDPAFHDMQQVGFLVRLHALSLVFGVPAQVEQQQAALFGDKLRITTQAAMVLQVAQAVQDSRVPFFSWDDAERAAMVASQLVN